MKKFSIAIAIMLMSSLGFSQASFYKVGDTLFYANNRVTFLKTNTLVIIKETNVGENNNVFKVDKYTIDNSSKENKYVLDSKFTTNGLQVLKSNGNFISYYKNGNKASEGNTVNGKKDNGIWTYFYENGEKKSEEKMSTETFFNDKTENLVTNFWDEKGRQTVTNGNGFVQYKDEAGKVVKGSYKDGLKNELWTAFDGKTKKYEETYKKGKLSKGTSWDSSGKSFTYKELNTPTYYKRKDNRAVRKYIDKKLSRTSGGIDGDLIVNFSVTEKGVLKNINVVKGFTADYNSEVKKILTEMEGWVPAKKRGQPVSSLYSLDLRFKR
ncbi:MAG: hypothetical protein AB8B78_00555 [Polaribacter sp.]